MAVNLKPTSTNAEVTLDEDGTYRLTVADFGRYADANLDPLFKIRFTTPVTAGVIEYFDGVKWVDVNVNPDPFYFAAAHIDFGILRYRPAADAHGDPYAYVRFLVHDGWEDSAGEYVLRFNVEPVNDAPTAAGASATTLEDTPLNVQPLPAAADVDGDAVTYERYTDAAHGEATVFADGRYTYVPEPGFHGADAFSFIVSDGQGGSNTYSVVIDVQSVNDLPVSSSASVSTKEDTPLQAWLPEATDADGDALVYTKVSGPAHGTVAIGADGSFTYTPAAEFHGDDSFVFGVDDGSGQGPSYAIDVRVLPVNDAPVASGGSASTVEGEALSVLPLPTATDVDGDPITYAKAGDASHGQLTVFADGHFSYVPEPGYFGADAFSFSVSDGQGGSNIYAFDLAVRPFNVAPVAAAGSTTTREDQPVQGRLPMATDADGDPVTYAAVSNPSLGSVQVAADGRFVYTPAPDRSGVDAFVFSVDDGRGGTSRHTFSVDVLPVNDAPTAASGAASTAEGQALNAQLLPGASDIDGDAVGYAKLTDPVHGRLTVFADGRYTYIPEAGFVGLDAFSFVVSDGRGGENAYTFTVDVQAVNDVPVAADAAVTVAEDGVLQARLPAAVDADDDLFIYTKVSGPAHGSLEIQPDGSYRYVPQPDYAGPDAFVYSVSDGAGLANRYTVDVTVTPVNDAPTSTLRDAQVVPGGALIAQALPPASDVEGDVVTYAKAADPLFGSLIVYPDGRFSYAPAANYSGADAFAFSVSDGKGGSNAYTFHLWVGSNPNAAPVSAGGVGLLTSGRTLNAQLPAASDADADSFFYEQISDPSNGTVIVRPDGSYTYTPKPGITGFDSFVFAVVDERGAHKEYTQRIVMTAGNQVPESADAAGTTREDTVLRGQLPVAVDLDEDPVVYAKAEDPVHGTVVILADGSYEYMPDPHYHGPDAFSFSVSDDEGGSATYRVALRVNAVNDAPVASDAAFTTPEDVALVGRLPAAADADGDAALYSVAADPMHGTVTIAMDGRFTYVPAADYHGGDSFRFEVNDGLGGLSIHTVALTVDAVNDTPVALDAAFSTPEDVALQGRLPQASDADGDAVVYAKASDPSHGSVTVEPDGSFTYVPAADYHGGDSFRFEVSDGLGGLASYDVALTVTPVIDPPWANWTALARMGNAWFDGTFGQATMLALQAELDTSFGSDPVLYAAEVYARYGVPIGPKLLAQSVADRLGLTGEANAAWASRVEQRLLSSSDPHEQGRILLAETDRFTTLVDDPLFGVAARRFNAEIDAALKYAQIPGTSNVMANPDGSPVELPAAPVGSSRVGGLSAGSGTGSDDGGVGLGGPLAWDASWLDGLDASAPELRAVLGAGSGTGIDTIRGESGDSAWLVGIDPVQWMPGSDLMM